MKEEQIIEAARKLFHQFGFKKVSMDEIAKEAGVTKRTIYMYFKNKEELLKFFIMEEIRNMKNIIEEVEKKDIGYFDVINEAIYKLLKYVKETHFLSVISKEAKNLNNPIIVQNLKLIDEQIKNYIKEKLINAKEKGYIYYDDIEITAFLIYKMYIALILEWDDESKKIDEQMIAKNITNILKNGLRKEVR